MTGRWYGWKPSNVVDWHETKIYNTRLYNPVEFLKRWIGYFFRTEETKWYNNQRIKCCSIDRKTGYYCHGKQILAGFSVEKS